MSTLNPSDTRIARPVTLSDAGFLGLLAAGLTNEQMSRLADQRVQAQRGAYHDDGAAAPGSDAEHSRFAFARWLVETGRLTDDR